MITFRQWSLSCIPSLGCVLDPLLPLSLSCSAVHPMHQRKGSSFKSLCATPILAYPSINCLVRKVWGCLRWTRGWWLTRAAALITYVHLQIACADFSGPSGDDTRGCSLEFLSRLGGSFISPREVGRDFAPCLWQSPPFLGYLMHPMWPQRLTFTPCVLCDTNSSPNSSICWPPPPMIILSLRSPLHPWQHLQLFLRWNGLRWTNCWNLLLKTTMRTTTATMMAMVVVAVAANATRWQWWRQSQQTTMTATATVIEGSISINDIGRHIASSKFYDANGCEWDQKYLQSKEMWSHKIGHACAPSEMEEAMWQQDEEQQCPTIECCFGCQCT